MLDTCLACTSFGHGKCKCMSSHVHHGFPVCILSSVPHRPLLLAAWMWEVRVREPNMRVKNSQDLIDLFLFDCLFTFDHDNKGTAGVTEAVEAENTCLQLFHWFNLFRSQLQFNTFFCFGELGCSVFVYIISTNININICYFSLLLSNHLGTVRCTLRWGPEMIL